MNKISAYSRLARLDKPVGIWLLYIPCLFGLLLAQSVDAWLYVAFFFGSVLMRSAGCVINDMFDRKIDAQVERTKNRPLASGELNLREALTFLSLLLAASLGILFTLPIMAVVLGFAIVPFVVSYPLMKRFTHYPQLFLGITFNFGVLVAYAAATAEIASAPVILYLGCIFWTVAYDTIYALQDVEDDMRIGVKSTAISFAKHFHLYTGICFALFLTAFYVAAKQAEVFSPLTISALILCSIGMAYQTIIATPKKPELCLMLFKMNVVLGFVLASGLLPVAG